MYKLLNETNQNNKTPTEVKMKRTLFNTSFNYRNELTMPQSTTLNRIHINFIFYKI